MSTISSSIPEVSEEAPTSDTYEIAVLDTSILSFLPQWAKDLVTVRSIEIEGDDRIERGRCTFTRDEARHLLIRCHPEEEEQVSMKADYIFTLWGEGEA